MRWTGLLRLLGRQQEATIRDVRDRSEIERRIEALEEYAVAVEQALSVKQKEDKRK